jgi:hypothetical protein
MWIGEQRENQPVVSRENNAMKESVRDLPQDSATFPSHLSSATFRAASNANQTGMLHLPIWAQQHGRDVLERNF